MHFASRTQLLTAKVAAAGVAFALTTASMSGCTAFTPVPKALTQTPAHERTLLIADTYAAQGHTRRAEMLYAEVLRSRPNNPQAVAGLARIAGQTAEPQQMLAKAAKPVAPPAQTKTAAAPTPPVAIASFSDDDGLVPPPPAEPAAGDFADAVELLPPPPAEPTAVDAAPPALTAEKAAPAAKPQPARTPLPRSTAHAKRTSTAEGEQVARDGWADEFFAVAAVDETGLDADLNDVIAAAYGLTAADLVASDETATDETAAELPTIESVAQAAAREASTLDADAWQPAAHPADPAVVTVASLVPDLFELPATPFAAPAAETLATETPATETPASDWRPVDVTEQPVARQEAATEPAAVSAHHAGRITHAAAALRADAANAAAWTTFDENLASGDPARQTLAVLTMGELPPACHAAAAERLQDALTTESDDEVRSAAALALGGLGRAAEPAVPALRRVMQTAAQRPADAARVSLLCLGYEE